MNNEQLILQKLDAVIDQNVAIKEQNVAIQAELAIVRKKVETIEKTVLVIKGKVCSGFEGVEPETREQIQQLAEEATEEETAQVIVDFADNMKSKSRSTRKQAARNGKAASVGRTLKSINGYSDPSEEASFGHWFSNFTKQLFGVHLNSAYHLKLSPLMEACAMFYLIERDHGGRRF